MGSVRFFVLPAASPVAAKYLDVLAGKRWMEEEMEDRSDCVPT
jgi:hypothetical protein